MTPEETAIIERLANKLGTTADGLFDVLVIQAPISSTTEILTTIFIAWAFYRSIQFLMKVNIDNVTPMVTLPIMISVFSFFWLFTFLISLSNIMAGFVNPEYRALHEILEVLK